MKTMDRALIRTEIDRGTVYSSCCAAGSQEQRATTAESGKQGKTSDTNKEVATATRAMRHGRLCARFQLSSTAARDMAGYLTTYSRTWLTVMSWEVSTAQRKAGRPRARG